MPLVLCRRILRGELIPFRDTSITLHGRRHSLQESDEECSSWNRELTVYEVRARRGYGSYLAKTLSGYPFGHFTCLVLQSGARRKDTRTEN
jgi:hypothetical protein